MIISADENLLRILNFLTKYVSYNTKNVAVNKTLGNLESFMKKDIVFTNGGTLEMLDINPSGVHGAGFDGILGAWK